MFRIKHFLQKKIFKDVSTLMVGTLIGQLITIASMPVLTRIFTPAEYGIFSVFFNIACIIGFVSNGKLDSAIIMAKDDLKAELLLKSGVILTIIISILSLFVAFLIPDSLYKLINLNNLGNLLYLLPLAIFLIGIYQLAYAWANRKSEYKALSKNKVLQNSTTVAVSYLGGIAKTGTIGLIYGFILGYLISILGIIRTISSDIRKNILILKKVDFIKVIKEFKSFPLFLVPFTLINTFTVNILIFILGSNYDVDTIGFYNQANKVINYPLMLVTISFSTVFYQRLSISERKKKIYVYSLLFNFVLASIILTPFIFWGEEIFGFVFGDQWIIAGKMAKYLIPISVAGFAARNVSDVYSVTNSNHLLLIWQIFFLIGSILTIYIFSNSSIYTLLTWYSIWGTFVYSILALGGYWLLRKNN